MQPISVGVRDAKTNLSKLLKTVQQKGEIILTDRGRPVGRIVPIETEALPLKERVRRLEDQGVIMPLSRKSRKRIPPPIPVEDGLAQRLLKEDRQHREG